jgi:hypothetical protein
MENTPTQETTDPIRKVWFEILGREFKAENLHKLLSVAGFEPEKINQIQDGMLPPDWFVQFINECRKKYGTEHEPI